MLTTSLASATGMTSPSQPSAVRSVANCAAASYRTRVRRCRALPAGCCQRHRHRAIGRDNEEVEDQSRSHQRDAGDGEVAYAEQAGSSAAAVTPMAADAAGDRTQPPGTDVEKQRESEQLAVMQR